MQKLSSVLLIDDDATNNFLNERLLNRLEVADQLMVAETEQDALFLLAEFEESPPALILLDMEVSGTAGVEFLEHYQAKQQKQATVVVMHPATMNSHDLARMNGLSINGMISKPLTEEKIDQILQLHFQRALSA
ncbi:response regulator [Hymenobacter sp. GOD-10R]|uniref:response regulator n=1 Tax=Hymenobacter sp. GOD-10R TaxID=3093922 RepID=UPI002D78A520|nr:response regulator [Hymenobacter sp. GOD-10R]WRQ26539.1 response regulator [Hymenobacter sp. GOD-10R]